MFHFEQVRMPLAIRLDAAARDGTSGTISEPSSLPSPDGRRDRLSLWERVGVSVIRISRLFAISLSIFPADDCVLVQTERFESRIDMLEVNIE